MVKVQLTEEQPRRGNSLEFCCFGFGCTAAAFPAFPAFHCFYCFSCCRFSRLSVYFTLSHATDTRTQGKSGNTSSNIISSTRSSGKLCTGFVSRCSGKLPLSFSFWRNSLFIASLVRVKCLPNWSFVGENETLPSPVNQFNWGIKKESPSAECRMRLRHASRLDSGTNKAPANRFNLGYCAEISWNQVFGAPVWANLTFHFSQLMLLARFV